MVIVALDVIRKHFGYVLARSTDGNEILNVPKLRGQTINTTKMSWTARKGQRHFLRRQQFAFTS